MNSSSFLCLVAQSSCASAQAARHFDSSVHNFCKMLDIALLPLHWVLLQTTKHGQFARFACDLVYQPNMVQAIYQALLIRAYSGSSF